jgi:nicotinate-nucleotide pyrophosphorylase (carboxylating)
MKSVPFFYFRPVKYPYLTPAALDQFIAQALQEDLGDGDHSTLAVVPGHVQDCAVVLMKESGIIAGISLAEHIFRYLDPHMQIETFVADGDAVANGTVLMRVQGKPKPCCRGSGSCSTACNG